VQTGHVEIRSRAAAKAGSDGKIEPGQLSTASAARAAYDGGTELLTLTGAPRLADDTASLAAGLVLLDQRTGNVNATGGVQTVFSGTPGAAGGVGIAAAGDARAGQTRPVTHVLSASARLENEAKQMEFRGTDAEPARMWQDASQVQAATLLFDGLRKSFSARPSAATGLVHAVFATVGSAGKTTGAAAARQRKAEDDAPGKVVRVVSPKMDYNEALREATFTGGVRMDGTMGDARSQRVVVFLTPATKPGAEKPVKGTGEESATAASPFNGSLERVVASGDVQMEQPGRLGQGDQLLYTAATDTFVLTGTASHEPHIVDAKQGNVTGATLMFGQAGSTIVVAGDAAQGKAAHGRVRTETEVRP
jgi:lipopolysaccharide export system protein LptA